MPIRDRHKLVQPSVWAIAANARKGDSRGAARAGSVARTHGKERSVKTEARNTAEQPRYALIVTPEVGSRQDLHGGYVVAPAHVLHPVELALELAAADAGHGVVVLLQGVEPPPDAIHLFRERTPLLGEPSEQGHDLARPLLQPKALG